MDRLPRICGTSPSFATPEHCSTPPNSDPQPPGWIDYEAAERDLFAALNGEDGYARVLAADFGHNFGTDVADPEIVAEFADKLYTLAADILNQQGARQVFGDDHLYAKCQQWAKHWCDRQREREQFKRDRIEASAKSIFNQFRHKLEGLGGWIGFGIGTARSAMNQAMNADRRAREARRLRASGLKLREIAERFGVDIRTVSRYLTREIGEAAAKARERLKIWTSCKGTSCTDSENFDPSTRPTFASCPTSRAVILVVPDPPPIPPDEKGQGPDLSQAAEEMAALYPHRAAELAKLTG